MDKVYMRVTFISLNVQRLLYFNNLNAVNSFIQALIRVFRTQAGNNVRWIVSNEVLPNTVEADYAFHD